MDKKWAGRDLMRRQTINDYERVIAGAEHRYLDDGASVRLSPVVAARLWPGVYSPRS